MSESDFRKAVARQGDTRRKKHKAFARGGDKSLIGVANETLLTTRALRAAAGAPKQKLSPIDFCASPPRRAAFSPGGEGVSAPGCPERERGHPENILGKSKPTALAASFARRKRWGSEVVLYAFDLLEHDGCDLRDLPLIERKFRLFKLIGWTERRAIRYNEHLTGDGPAIFDHVCRMGLEVIVSKRTDAPYRSGPSEVWLLAAESDAPLPSRCAAEAR